MLFGASAPTGHRTMHSPHDSQRDSTIGLLPNVLIRVREPRKAKSSAPHADNLVAGPHADPAKHAAVVIQREERVGVVDLAGGLRAPIAIQALLVHAHVRGDTLELAVVVLAQLRHSP